MTQTILIATCCTLAALLTVCAIFLFKRRPAPAPDETIKLDLANLQRPTFALRLPHSKKVLHLNLPSKADTASRSSPMALTAAQSMTRPRRLCTWTS